MGIARESCTTVHILDTAFVMSVVDVVERVAALRLGGRSAAVARFGVARRSYAGPRNPPASQTRGGARPAPSRARAEVVPDARDEPLRVAENEVRLGAPHAPARVRLQRSRIAQEPEVRGSNPGGPEPRIPDRPGCWARPPRAWLPLLDVNPDNARQRLPVDVGAESFVVGSGPAGVLDTSVGRVLKAADTSLRRRPESTPWREWSMQR
jgi:hypothetical protein